MSPRWQWLCGRWRRARLSATVEVGASGSALVGVVPALAGLTALTRLKLTVVLEDSRWAAPLLVLPWANIEVSAWLQPAGRPVGACYARWCELVAWRLALPWASCEHVGMLTCGSAAVSLLSGHSPPVCLLP